MRIGIDIDGTLTEIDKWTLESGKKEGYQIKRYAYEARDIFDLTDIEADYFWNKYFSVLLSDVEVKKDAAQVIHELREKGHKIYLITARSMLDLPKDKKDTLDITKITLDWLKKHNIEYDHLEMSCFNKDVFCIKNKIDIMIEDSPINVIKISKVIPVICMDCSYNRTIVNSNIKRVYNWNQIAEIFK